MACRAGITLLLCSASLTALAPETPWTAEVDKEAFFEPFAGYTHLGPFPQHDASRDLFFQGLSIYISPDPEWQFLFEGTVAETTRTRFLFEDFRFVVSKILTDDIQGDCFTSLLSLDFRAVDGRALKEPALFHFGEFEWRGTFSVGKEYCQGCDWCYRSSLYGTFGIANRGSPWTEGGFSLERQWAPCERLGIDFNFLQSLGRKSIYDVPFQFGWAPYRFTLLSLGASYTRMTSCGEVTLHFERTLWTSDTFANVSTVSLALTY